MAPKTVAAVIALKKAAELIAEAAKANASRFSVRIPEAMKVYPGPGGKSMFVSAGKHGGRWGWIPMNAWMFEEPGARHPLFAHGPRGTDGWRHWYTQPYRPFMEEAAESMGQAAADLYADLSIRMWCNAATGWK